MTEYDITKIKQIFDEHGIFQFEVINVHTNDNDIFIHVKECIKQTVAEYCKKNVPKRFRFKNNNELYEVEKFYINVESHVKMVFVLKKDAVILNIFTLYECENSNLFANEYLHLSIDKVIKEDN